MQGRKLTYAVMLQEFRDETDVVKAGSLTEVVAVIASDVIEKFISKLAKQAPVQPQQQPMANGQAYNPYALPSNMAAMAASFPLFPQMGYQPIASGYSGQAGFESANASSSHAFSGTKPCCMRPLRKPWLLSPAYSPAS